MGTAFNTGLGHRLQSGAVLQDVTALHFAIGSSKPSVSTQIAALRNLFSGTVGGKIGAYFGDILSVIFDYSLRYTRIIKILIIRGHYHWLSKSKALTSWRR